MSLTQREQEILEELEEVLKGLHTFRYPDAAEGLRILADRIDQDEHDLDRIGDDFQNLIVDVNNKGEITGEVRKDLKRLLQDTKKFEEHLDMTRMLLNRGEVGQAFEIIDNFNKIEGALESLENLESRLEKIES